MKQCFILADHRDTEITCFCFCKQLKIKQLQTFPCLAYNHILREKKMYKLKLAYR